MPKSTHVIRRASDRSVRRILFTSAVWTFFIWGSRLRLIEVDASGWTQARIYVSLAFGFGLLAVALRPVVHVAAVATMLAYGMWMLVAWVPSVINVLGSTQSAAFQGVHTLLAVGSLTSGALVAGVGRRLARYPATTTSTQTAANNAAR